MTLIQIFFIVITMPQLLINLFSCLHLIGAKQINLKACFKVSIIQMIVFAVVSILQNNQLLQTVMMVGCLIISIRYFLTKQWAIAFILGLSVLFLDGLIQMAVLVMIKLMHIVVNETALLEVMGYTFVVVGVEALAAWVISNKKIKILELEI